jgi:hypothetical protein
MKTSALLALFILGGLVAVPANAEPTRTDIAQSESRCGPRPMKPMSCLNGAWVCRCRGSGQVCNWELIGCQTTPGTSRPLGERSRSSSDPRRPDPLGR